MLALKRPGTGISPKYLDSLIDMTLLRDVKKDTPLTWDDLEKKR
jgi:sialic acid synthase SpsE